MTPKLIPDATSIAAVGEPPKLIEEFVGRVNTSDTQLSIARMTSPAGWSEPGQTPDFAEYTIVLSGTLRVEHSDGVLEVHAGQGVHTPAGKWVRYSTTVDTQYVAVCLPAFSPDTVHRDA